jgi:hypothetical protein
MMKKYKLIIMLICLQNFIFVYNQIPDYLIDSCATNLKHLKSTDPASWFYVTENPDVWDDYQRYFPLSDWSNLKIRVNFVFLLKDDGTGNFQPNNTEHMNLINDVIDVFKSTYSNLIDTEQNICYAGNYSFMEDAKIEFIVNKIFINDSYGWNNENGSVCPGTSSWYLSYIDDQINNNPEIPKGINVFFTEDASVYQELIVDQSTTDYNADPVSCSQFPSTKNIVRSSRVHMRHCFTKFWWMKNIYSGSDDHPEWDPTVRNWYLGVGRSIAHEIGHSLGLRHSNQWHGLNQCDNSVMHQSGINPRNYLPPTEIGKLRLSLSITNLQQFVTNDSYIATPLEINNNEDWEFNTRLYRNLKLTSELVVNNKIELPYQGLNIIKENGKFVLDNNASLGSMNDYIRDIITKHNGYFGINTGEINNYKITIENNGTLQIKDEFFLNDDGVINIKPGGYICIDNSADLTLENHNNSIVLEPGYHTGVNTSVVPDPGTCVNDMNNLSFNGNGKIVYLSDDVFAQNISINDNIKSIYTGESDIFVGANVINDAYKSTGPVTIESGSDVSFNIGNSLSIENDFEVKQGAEFRVEVQSSYPSEAVFSHHNISVDQSSGIQWHTVNFNDTYTNPVVVMGPMTYEGTDPSTLRVKNVSSGAFEFQIDEWDYLFPGTHYQERVDYMVMEAGTYTIGDIKVEAGIIDNVDHNVKTHVFTQNFSTTPIVITQVITYNGSDAVVTRLNNISQSQFQVKLQEQENKGTHVSEKVAYIAIEPGYGYVNGQRIEAGRTGNTVTDDWHTILLNHVFTTPPTSFVGQIQTYDGGDPCGIRKLQMSASDVVIKIEEEQSANSETDHTTEVVGYIVIE